MKRITLLWVFICTGLFIMLSCKHETVTDNSVVLPPISGTNTGICFQSEILPLFQSNCAKSGCHDAISHQGDYVFDSYANIIRKDLIPGNATNSKIYKVLFESGNDRMPPPPNTDLGAVQKVLIGQWINEGAKNTINCNVSCDSTQFKYAANISLITSTYCTGCHGGATPSANIDLSNYAGVKLVAQSGRLVGAVTHDQGYAPMPNGTNKLSDCQITQIKKWVVAGSLNN